MKKISSIFIMILSIVLLVGCSFLPSSLPSALPTKTKTKNTTTTSTTITTASTTKTKVETKSTSSTKSTTITTSRTTTVTIPKTTTTVIIPTTKTTTKIVPTTTKIVPTTKPVVSTTTTTQIHENSRPILISDFGKYNSTHNDYGTSYTEDVPNSDLDVNSNDSMSYTLKGVNANGSNWDYVRFGKKNLNATIEGLENYIETNFRLSFSSISFDIVKSISNLKIYLQSSADQSSWTTDSIYTINNSISSIETVTIDNLNINNKFIRIVFVSNGTPGTSNGWLVTLKSISYNTSIVGHAPIFSVPLEYKNNQKTILIDSTITLPSLTVMDEEDGELTSNIVSNLDSIDEFMISSNTYKFTKAGEYLITFSVIDSDNNETSISLIIIVESSSLIPWDNITYYQSLVDSDNDIYDLAYLLRDTIEFKTYGDARYVYVEDTNNLGYQYVLYDMSEKNIPLSWGTGGKITLEDGTTYTVNREHVWACNNMRIRPEDSSKSIKSFPHYVLLQASDEYDYRPETTNRGHYSDLHNLWNANESSNKSHSDKFYGGSPASFTDNINEGPKLSGDFFFPGEEYVGDCARICFYMSLVYPYLTLVDSTNVKAEGSIYYGLLDTFLYWNEIDPVSPEEIQRNNTIFGIQKNRNPFVDFYNYNIAEYIFGNGDVEVPQR